MARKLIDIEATWNDKDDIILSYTKYNDSYPDLIQFSCLSLLQSQLLNVLNGFHQRMLRYEIYLMVKDKKFPKRKIIAKPMKLNLELYEGDQRNIIYNQFNVPFFFHELCAVNFFINYTGHIYNDYVNNNEKNKFLKCLNGIFNITAQDLSLDEIMESNYLLYEFWRSI